MNLKSKSKLFHALVEKIDIALASEHNFDRIADKLKNLHIKVGDDYMKPLHTDLCTKNRYLFTTLLHPSSIK